MRGITVIFATLAMTSVLVAQVASPSFPKSKIAGKWTLGTKGSPKFELHQNGTFVYAGWGNTSKGNWSFDGTTLQLLWTVVDGYKVKPGSMRGKYAISPEGVLQVDKYSYRKT